MSQPYTATAILLAGGMGRRMQTSTPKQYLTLGKKTIAHYSLDCFSMIPEVVEIIIVCDESYHSLFENVMPDIDLHFAQPGTRRQDSMHNGFLARKHNTHLICIHDAARPFVTTTMTKRVMDAAIAHGAATAAVPLKFTVKEGSSEGFVVATPHRDSMWEVQTPQAVTPDLLQQGIEKAEQLDVTVTDDVSLVELLGKPVKLVTGDECNIKITTPGDLQHAEALLATLEEVSSIPSSHQS